MAHLPDKALFCEAYPRSLYDSDADATGCIHAIISRLAYIRECGFDPIGIGGCLLSLAKGGLEDRRVMLLRKKATALIGNGFPDALSGRGGPEPRECGFRMHLLLRLGSSRGCCLSRCGHSFFAA